MAIKHYAESTDSYGQPPSIIVSNWLEPLEAFVPHPKYVNPLRITPSSDWKDCVRSAREDLEVGESLVAHETSRHKAEKILNEGFRTESHGYTPIRDEAVFGWIHKDDIGIYGRDVNRSADTLVLFKAPIEHMYISSYSTSAMQLILGQISPIEYEKEHILPYSQYEKTLFKNEEIMEHLPYDRSSLLPKI